MDFLIGIMRFIAPACAIIVLATCIISLFRNRPRIHKLAQLVNQEDGTIIDIDHWETSIGKAKSNDIVLDLVGVSRFHAVIAKKRKNWVVTDTFSRNGILVNGEEVDSKQVIEDGDVITIGVTNLIFQCVEAMSAKTKEAIRNEAKKMPSQNRTVAYAVLVDTKTHKPIYLKKQDVLIGRADNCDIQILSDAVSNSHARIYQTSRGWALTDLDSHNGTKLNGRFINEPQLIFDEDMITFADKVFIFYEK